MTSKEENPTPNYTQMLRNETKTDKLRRIKVEEKFRKPDIDVEMDIISNTVEQMIAKMNEKRKAPA